MSTLAFPSCAPFETRVSDPFDQFSEMVGGRLVNVMGDDDRSHAAVDPVMSALDPVIWLVNRVPVACIDIPEDLAIVKLPDNTVDRRARRSVGRTKYLLGVW